MEKSIFMLNDHSDGSRTYDANRVYSLADNEADGLVSTGKATEVNFPQLAGFKGDSDALVGRYKAKRDEIKASERYNDNESEREYQLAALRKELSDEIAAKRDDYAVELETMYRLEAEKAFKVDITAEAQSFVNSVQTQFASDIDKSDLAHMLIARLKTASDDEKHAFSIAYPGLKANIPESQRGEVEGLIKNANTASQAVLNCKILRCLPESVTPFTAYDILEAVEKHGK